MHDTTYPGTPIMVGSGCGSRSMSGGHDLDGDGYDDPVFAIGFDPVGARLGSPRGLGGPIPLVTAAATGSTGVQVQSLGDADGDGYGDVYFFDGAGNHVLIYGSSAGPSARTTTLTVP